MKHIHVMSKTPQVAESQGTDLAFILSLVTFGFEIATVLFSAFGTVFDGLIGAITVFTASKNPPTA